MEKNKLEYTLIRNVDTKLFVQNVNKAIQEGWMLQGGISCYTEGNNSIFIQAVIRIIKVKE